MSQVLERYSFRLGYPEARTQSDPSRRRWLNNTNNWLRRKLPNSLSYFTCLIDGKEQNCAVLSSNNIDTKKIVSMPGESLQCGSYVEWMDCVWLITELNAANELYQYATMQQCNHELKWINDKGELITRWVCAADGTKYMTGEYYQSMMTVGDARFQITMPRDEETAKIRRGDRFLIDDPITPDPLAYELTKPNRVSYTFGGEGRGVYIHMFVESPVQQDDNTELMIANYYSKMAKAANGTTVSEASSQEPELVLEFLSGSDVVYVGTSAKIAVKTMVGGEVVNSEYECSIDCPDSTATVSVSDGVVTVSAGKDRSLIGTVVRVTITDSLNGVSVVTECEIRGWV